MNFGGWEIMLVVAVLFMLFGASRLPQLAKSIGQTRKAFKDGMREAEDEAAEEERQKTLNHAMVAPQINGLSDEQLTAEMRRRAEVKQQ